MAKQPRRKKSVVLGLRASPEQKAWLNSVAKARGLTIQALFDEIMLNYASSGWLPTDPIKVPFSLRAVAYGRIVAELFESKDKYKSLQLSVAPILRGIKRLMLIEDAAVKEGSNGPKTKNNEKGTSAPDPPSESHRRLLGMHERSAG